MNVLLEFHPQNTVFVRVHPQVSRCQQKYPQVSKKGFYSPIYEIKPRKKQRKKKTQERKKEERKKERKKERNICPAGKCEPPISEHRLVSSHLGWAMKWVDRIRTSSDELVLSGRRAVLIA